jgi:transposase
VLNFTHQTRVFLCTQPVDMRKSFRGLCLLAESLLGEDPASGHWFVFLNRRADRLKLLGWDGRAFWIWYTHLEAGTFQSPAVDDDAAHVEIDVTQLALIIHGIDLKTAQRRTRYQPRKAS